MHRSQIMLEDKQYNFLKNLSKQEEKSISSIIREMINKYLEKRKKRSLSSIVGIATDNEIHGEDHDKILYGN